MLNKYSKILSAILIVFISFAALVLLFGNSKTTTEVSAFACKSEHANCDNASDHDCCSGLSCQDGRGGWKCRTASTPTATPTPTPTPTVTPTATPTPTPGENECKHEHAECNINGSGKSCCEGLTCVPSGNPSGNGHCQVGTTPTPTPTPSPTIDPCADNQCATPTPTPTPTPTETTTNSGGPGDGLGCATHDCSNHPSSQGSTGGQVLGASTGPQVLGLSTTSGEENYLLQLIQAAGAFVSGSLGFIFFKKNG
jgi:hypothetical protein